VTELADIQVDGGVRLHVEEVGKGFPILFIHEFAGNHLSWEPQVRYFSRSHRCISYSARGYVPSMVPADVDSYSQEIAVADAIGVLDALGVDRAHVVGLSMGGFTALNLMILNPGRVAAAVIAGVGYGAHPNKQESFKAECEVIARAFERDGAQAVSARYAVGPARVQFQNKNPRGWAEFADALARHSDLGMANTMRGVQARRPSLYEMRDELSEVRTPVLVLVGDEDEGCLDASLMLKRTIPSSSLEIFPKTGHTANLEEPERFNSSVDRFLASTVSGEWRGRDPRSVSTSTTGMTSSSPVGNC
jgi:pimeloyl-ACP methyl ester carboxylesterase